MGDKLNADPPMLDEVEFAKLCYRVIDRWHAYDPEFHDTVFLDADCAVILGPPCEPHPHVDLHVEFPDDLSGICAPLDCGRYDALSLRECAMLIKVLRSTFPTPRRWEVRTSRFTIEDQRQR